jgi:alpha-tubulin suppressor-like RCC1 family protein
MLNLLPIDQDVICVAACGSDFCVAVSDSGSIFGWGSNSQGQLGRPPLETSSDQQATR